MRSGFVVSGGSEQSRGQEGSARSRVPGVGQRQSVPVECDDQEERQRSKVEVPRRKRRRWN